MIISIWHCESVGFAMQNSRFYRAKPTLLECKNNRFCKALIVKWLCNSWVCEKYLHFCYSPFVHKMGCFH